METPLYSTLNRATGFRDERAIPTLGPYAYLLFSTLDYTTPDNLEKMKEMATETERDENGEIMKYHYTDGRNGIKKGEPVRWITLYRGLGLPEDAI